MCKHLRVEIDLIFIQQTVQHIVFLTCFVRDASQVVDLCYLPEQQSSPPMIIYKSETGVYKT